MLHLVVFLLFFFILLPYYMPIKEPLKEATLPISFPRTDVVNLPNRMEFPMKTDYNWRGSYQYMKGLNVQGPTLLGIEGGGADLTYIEANKNNLLFNSAGYDQSADAVLFSEDGLKIEAGSVTLDTAVQSGPVNAPKANLTFLHVNRTDGLRYPEWGSGIHTLDIYANGTVGVGNNGQVAAFINTNGDLLASTLEAQSVVGEKFLYTVNNKEVEFIKEVDELKKKVIVLNEQIRVRNERREAERREAERREAERREAERRAAEERNRNRGRRRGGCSVM